MADRNNLSVKIDYLTIIFEKMNADTLISEVLRIPIDYFSVQEATVRYKNYTKLYQFGEIKVYGDSEATDKNRYGLGCFLVLGGKGCDELYSWLERANKSYRDFFKELYQVIDTNDLHLTRVDLAIDDKNYPPYFTMEQIKKKCSKGDFISSCKSYEIIESSFLDSTAKTIYIGKGKSNLSFRFYDKDKEQSLNLNTPYNPLNSWKRTEMQLRDDTANSFIKLLIRSDKTLGKLTFDFLSSNVRFLVRDKNQKNKSRWKTCEFWIRYLGAVEQVTLENVEKESSLLDTQKWLEVGGSIPAIVAFQLLEKYQALGDLKKIETMMSKARFSPKLSNKIVSHLHDNGREDLISLVYEYTKDIEK